AVAGPPAVPAVAAGVLNLGVGSGAPAAASYGYSGALTNNGAVSFTGGTNSFTGAYSGTGALTFSGGTNSINTASTIANMTLSGGTLQGAGMLAVTNLTMNGGAFSLNNAGVTSLAMGNGTLNVTGTLTTGMLTVTGGTLTGPGSYTVTGATTFTPCLNCGDYLYVNGAVLNTQGAVTHTRNGASLANVYVKNGGTINNTGTWTLDAVNVYDWGGVAGYVNTFNNAATVNVGAGSGTISTAFVNSGNLNLNGNSMSMSGQVTLNGGILNGGTVTAGALTLYNALSINGPASVTLDKIIVNQSGATTQGSLAVSSPIIMQNGAAINNTGTWTLNNAAYSQGLGLASTFSNGGSFVVPSGGSALFTGVAFANTGTLTATGSLISGTLVNAGLLDITGQTVTKHVTNNGTMNVTGGGTASITGDVINNATFNITGTANLNRTFTNNAAGTVNLTGTLNVGLGATNGGAFNVASGSTINSSSFANNAGTLALNGATINGALTNGGTGVITSGGVNSINGTLANTSTAANGISVAVGSVLNVAGDASNAAGATLLLNGTLNAGLAFSNAGTVGTSAAGILTSGADITNTGSINAAAGSTQLTLQAVGSVILNGVTTTNGASFTVTANSSGINGGNIRMGTGAGVNTAGGSIVFGGGVGGTGAAMGTGTASSAVASGIYLSGATLNAGGGNITMRGAGASGVSFGADGIYITNGSVVQTTGAGAITLSGTGGAGGAGSSLNSGIRLGTAALLSSVNGTIALNGQGGSGALGSNYGVYVHNGARIASTGSTVTLSGAGGVGAASNAILLSGAPVGGVVNAAAGVSMSGTGPVVINGPVLAPSISVRATGITLGTTLSASGIGNAIVLDAGLGNFINNAGSGALVNTGGGRWLIYSANPANDTFGSLSSANLPLWNKTYAGYSPSSVVETGNRYLFSYQPALIASVNGGNITRTYGAVSAAPATTITGLVNAATYGGVFTQESYGTGAASSAGLAANAPVTATPYVVTADLITPVGYGATTYNNVTLTVNPATLMVTATGVDKVYDGTMTGHVTLADNRFSWDAANLGITYTASFADKNAGVAKPLNVTGFALTGVAAGNYTLANATVTATANITIRPNSTWSGAGGNNLWSNPANWDVLPDLGNVAAVSIPVGVNVTYDAGAGTTSLQTLSGGILSLTGGTLNLNNAHVTSLAVGGGTLNNANTLTTSSMKWSAGTLTGSGTINVTNTLNLYAGSSGGRATLDGNGKILSNQGVATQTADLYIKNGAIVNNEKGAVWTVNAGNLIDPLGGSFNNLGAFNTKAGVNVGVAFTNSGTMDLTGSLNFVGATGIFVNSGGTVNGTVILPGGSIWQAPSSVTTPQATQVANQLTTQLTVTPVTTATVSIPATILDAAPGPASGQTTQQNGSSIQPTDTTTQTNNVKKQVAASQPAVSAQQNQTPAAPPKLSNMCGR
ncbi:MAG: hypothetical protein K2P57_00925, partial [Burkholderiales bacterium]|nr:hypothetical protein [Burkholderiales bacterium]